MMAARTTDPPVGASTCASGSQVWTGHIGTFTANAIRKARKIMTCSLSVSGSLCQAVISNVPLLRYRKMMAISVRSEPSSV